VGGLAPASVGAGAVALREVNSPQNLVGGSFTSAALRGAETGWAISYPPGESPGAHLPVLIALHGKGGNHRDAFTSLGLADAQESVPAAHGFAISSVDGGGDYWHRRRDGRDAGVMLTDELLPVLEGQGLVTDRVALLGWSMGGYGSLLLAATRLHGRVTAVMTMSAALWTTSGASAPGAFDDAEDFRANDVFAMRPALASVPLLMDCGTSDPFVSANHAFVDGMTPRPAANFESGGHDDTYWRAMAPRQLTFVAEHLSV